MHELEEQAIREEDKSHPDFLSTCQAIPSTPQGESVNLLPHLVWAITFYHFNLLHSPGHPR